MPLLNTVSFSPDRAAARPSAAYPAAGGQGRDSPPDEVTGWLHFAAWGLVLLLLAGLVEGFGQAAHHILLLFFFGLALLVALLPAGGPRGQRVSLLPGVGLAASLLLPPLTATLPLLLASALYAVLRDTPAARAEMRARGTWLTAAALAAGFTLSLLTRAHRSDLSSQIVLAICVYGAVYAGGSQGSLRRARGRRAFGRHWRSGGRLEMAGLVACAPVAALMALVAPRLGVPGVAAAAGLMALLLVIAYFGFEVSLLREQVRAMEKISAVTLSQTNPHKVIERFLQLSSGLIPCDRAALWLTDNSQTRLDRVARRQATSSLLAQSRLAESQGLDARLGEPVSVRFGEGLIGRVADRQAPLIIRDGARDPRSASVEAQGRSGSPFALLLLPLVAGGETIGVAQFERDLPGNYTPRDMMRVRSLAGLVAAMIANMHMHRDVYNQAVTDGLTGLFNRRHVQTALVDERQRAYRYGHALSIVLLDVDGFKGYNDTYGHPQGDVLLKKLAAVLRETVREVDIVGRYGGEEFIVLLPETSKDEACRTAERLRAAVAAAVFPGFADDPEMTVPKTISLGVATYPADASDVQTLVAQADQALYRAKRGGRNQVMQAEPFAPSDIVADAAPAS